MGDSHSKKRTTKLDRYEAELERTIDKAKPLSKHDKEKMLSTLKSAADNYAIKNKRITIRVYGSDLENIKRIALQEGLPYQTLITSILHKFATGQFHQSHK